MSVDVDALVQEVYADCDAKKRGWSRHGARVPKVQQRKVRVRVARETKAQHVEPVRLPPLVHPPCERWPFDPDKARLRAGDWLWINLDSHDERVLH